jgi:2'-phosphotransferase
MKRNHIHLAQGIADQNVVSGKSFLLGLLPLHTCNIRASNIFLGMRQSADILIFIDVQKAIDAGFKFLLSSNGVVLTEGNDDGYLPTEFFQRVEQRIGILRQPLTGWAGITKSEESSENITNFEQGQETLETDAVERQ